METIQNNVAQNLMAIFPTRPPELILECVTHPRNCYSPVDEGVLLNRCIDDLLSREGEVKDDAQNEIIDDFVVDDIPEGEPVVIDDPEAEDVVTTIPNLQDLSVDVPEIKDIFIDLTEDSPQKPRESNEISSTKKSVGLINSSSKDSTDSFPSAHRNNDIDETDGDLSVVLGFPTPPDNSKQSKISKEETRATNVVLTPVMVTGGELDRKSNPSLGILSKADVPTVSSKPSTTGVKVHQLNSQEHVTRLHAATTSNSVSSSKSKVSTSAGGQSGPVHNPSQPKSNTGPINTSFKVGRDTGEKPSTSRSFAAASGTGSSAASAPLGKGTFNAQARQVHINGCVGPHPGGEQKLKVAQINQGWNGNYYLGSATTRGLTVRQELERRRSIPATLSRAPSDEEIPIILGSSPGRASDKNTTIDLTTPLKSNVKEGNKNCNGTALNSIAKDNVKIGNMGVPLKITTPVGVKIHSKAETLSRAPAASSTGLNMSFKLASSLPLNSISVSRPSAVSQSNVTTSGQTSVTQQGAHIRPVILKSSSLSGNTGSQGIRLGSTNASLPKTNTANILQQKLDSPTTAARPGNGGLLLANSSNSIQGKTLQGNTQLLGGAIQTSNSLPKFSHIGGSAFSSVKQRPVQPAPHNTPQAPHPRGSNQAKTGSACRGLSAKTVVGTLVDVKRLIDSQKSHMDRMVKETLKGNAAVRPPPVPPREPFPLHPPTLPRPLPLQPLPLPGQRLPLPPPPPPQPQRFHLPPPHVPAPSTMDNHARGYPNPAPGAGLGPALRMGVPPATATAPSGDVNGMEAASVEFENMVQTVMKMFPNANEGIVRGLLLENRNVNATCNYLLENADAMNGGTATVHLAKPEEKKEPEVVIDYINIPYHKRGHIASYHQYFNQGLDLLSNEFVKISKTSLRLIMQSLCHGSYAKAKKVLDDAIQADPNIQVMMQDDTKGSFFHVEKCNRNYEIRLMKKARKPIPMAYTLHSELQKEVDFYKKHIINETAKADFEVALKLNEDQYEQEGQLIECGCCYLEVTFESMIQCLEGHLFCQTCLQSYTKEAVFGQGKATLSCLEDGCDSVFPRSQLEKTLTKEILVKYDERVGEESINLADMDNLLRCPNCNYAAILDNDHKVFSCPECHKETCRNCKEPWKDHYGLECDQVKKQSTMRLTYQERMTEAKVRTCYKCGTKFTKSEGCNKMTCRCGAKMCYICRQPIKDYSHFDNQPAPPHGQIYQQKPGQKCRLWTNSDEDDNRAVQEIEKQMKAEERALREKGGTDLKRPSTSGTDDGVGSDAKRPRTG